MRTLYSIYWFCVFHISKLTNTYSYSMNAPYLIINKVDDFGTFLAQSVHEDVVLYILVLCVSYI